MFDFNTYSQQNPFQTSSSTQGAALWTTSNLADVSRLLSNTISGSANLSWSTGLQSTSSSNWTTLTTDLVNAIEHGNLDPLLGSSEMTQLVGEIISTINGRRNHDPGSW